MSSPQPKGPEWVAIDIEDGEFVLTRDDGSTWIVPGIDNIYLTEATFSHDGNAGLTITTPEV